MASPVSVALHTLGCKLNFSETSAIGRKFVERGFQLREFTEDADVYVINTCSVTEFADRKCRAAVRQAQRNNPSARIVVIGCYAQLKPQEIATIEGVDLVLGAAEKFNVINYIDLLGQQKGKGLVKCDEIETVNSFEEAFSYGDRTRVFLKVQDGCDYNCSFCTIPLARGKSRSGNPSRILTQIRDLETRGVQEVVLTGVNIGDYGKGLLEESSFLELISQIDATSSIPRFRISSIEPNLCTKEIIEFVAKSNRFMPHFHMPLQSGSDEMLAKMRRRYRVSLYRDRVAQIRQLMPDACIGVDVIVGFPGESEQDFMETYRFLNELPVSYLHVFTYSQRDDTPAAVMPDQIPLEERRRRNKMLRTLSVKKQRAFAEMQIGTIREVILEADPNKDLLRGFTENYIKISMPRAGFATNDRITVQLKALDENGLVLVEPKKKELAH